MKRLILLIAACLPLLGSAQYKSQVWCPDKGDGTYTNPVINADYSDPDVCVGTKHPIPRWVVLHLLGRS